MSEIAVSVSVSVDQSAADAAISQFEADVLKSVRVTVGPTAPSVCIGCGAVRQSNGEMPCDH
ncbi:hypothetical protein EJ774_21210 [Pandoraea apista]|uniref:Uncharacterized protein n=1 Tax=Pandoraea apista TaxID=93218 RepID=A0ABX9ZLG3_9BURK|nr:hypothetical protein [Pandoraea apista]RSK77876.1 hypothetical protein EJE83_17975 [Pandoraea apista]RUN81863.1 hypothetical protein EJ774_21210 [Pandoraea apista]